MHYFITEDNQSGPLEGKQMVKEGSVRFQEAPLEVEDLTDRDEPPQSVFSGRSEDLIIEVPNYENIPVCNNCDQNLVLTNVPSSSEPVLCVSCTKLLGSRQATLREPNIKISIPKNFASKEQRIHEFMLGIDTVVGFPLFAGIDDELSCYVDYKFPEITTNLKGMI